MIGDHPVNQCETHSRSTALGGEERLQQCVRVLGGQPDPGVLDLDRDLMVVGRQPEHDGAAVGDRPDRVVEQVDQRLPELDRVDNRADFLSGPLELDEEAIPHLLVQ